MISVATPFTTFAVPRDTEPLANCTVPLTELGSEPVGVTVAVKVTGCPWVAVVVLVVRLVVVAAWLTTTVAVAELNA